MSISATFDGYVGGAYGAVRPGDSLANRLELQLGEKLEDVTLRLWPGGGISGTVTDERG
jgi:hypothetical protein